MSEKKTDKPEKKIVYFHGFAYVPPEPSKLDDKYLVQPKPVLDPETGETKIDGSDKLDLYELTQSYRDQCGLEFMLKQMKLGIVAPESVADDGKHSGDASMPLDINDAYRAQLVQNEAKKMLKDTLGIKDELTEENIKARLAEIYGKADAPKVEAQEGDKQ